MNKVKLIIGSRGSDLALYQANFIQDILVNKHDAEVEIKIIKTRGDKFDQISFDKMEGKGFFTKELEDALLSKEIDLAVHSLKDLMTSQPDGLKLGAAGYRADCRELLLIRPEALDGDSLLPIKAGGIVGTSSARRKCQIAFQNQSLQIKDLRGNVPTRVNKLRDGQYDAIIIAAAGVTRLKLDLSGLEARYLDPEKFLPAPAQGILGIQIRSDDKRVEEIIRKLDDPNDRQSAELERGLLAKFDAGCSLPLGVVSEVGSASLRLKAFLGQRVGEGWGKPVEIDLTGNNTEQIVEQAFALLNGDTVQCD